MKKLIFFIFFMLTSCLGPDPVYIQGPPGPQGNPGITRVISDAPTPVVFDIVPATQEQCLNGGTIIHIATDTNHNNTPDIEDDNYKTTFVCNGMNGSNGQDGTSCSVAQVSSGDAVLPNGGAIVTCGSGSVLISNGEDGLDGIDGQNATPNSYDIVDILNPCGESPQVYDEVFLKLRNGQILWLLVDNVNGKNARLSLAQAGTWMTTDGDQCVFTLTSDGRIINENHHY
jgi:hypothetical protein